MTMYILDSVTATPKYTDGKSYRRLQYVMTLTVLRYDPDGVSLFDKGVPFVNERAQFDIYVDFRPGRRAQWRPWVYAYSSNTRHRLAPFERETQLGVYEFAIECGRREVTRRWWKLLRLRFPDVVVPELVT